MPHQDFVNNTGDDFRREMIMGIPSIENYGRTYYSESTQPWQATHSSLFRMAALQAASSSATTSATTDFNLSKQIVTTIINLYAEKHSYANLKCLYESGVFPTYPLKNTNNVIFMDIYCPPSMTIENIEDVEKFMTEMMDLNVCLLVYNLDPCLFDFLFEKAWYVFGRADSLPCSISLSLPLKSQFSLIYIFSKLIKSIPTVLHCSLEEEWFKHFNNWSEFMLRRVICKGNMVMFQHLLAFMDKQEKAITVSHSLLVSFAARYGQLEILEYLLQAVSPSTDVENRGKIDFQSALMYAAKHGHAEIMSVLWERSPLPMDGMFLTLFQSALEFGHLSVLKLVRNW